METAVLRETILKRKEAAQECLISAIDLHPWPDQPRKHFDQEALNNLARSIKSIGQKVPIMVCPDTERGKGYIIVDGERRWRACCKIGRDKVRCVILPPMSVEDRFVQSIVANFGREPHTALETALALQKIYDMGRFDWEKVAGMFGKSVGWVQQHLSLNKLDPRVVTAMNYGLPKEKRLKFSIALMLVALPKDLQAEISQEIVEKRMKVVEARYYTRNIAMKHGLKVGMGTRPDKVREALKVFLRNIAMSAHTFLEAKDIPLEKLLSQLPKDDLKTVRQMAADCQNNIMALFKAISKVN